MSETNQSSKVNFFLGLFAGMAIVSVIGFAILLAVVFKSGQRVDLSERAQAEQQPVVEQPSTANQPVAPILASEPFKGSKDAKVVIIEYTDFECPFCLRHHETSNQIIKEYGNKIQYVLRHFPLSFHANAQKAAEAFECGAEQGKAFEMADKLFEANQNKEMNVDKWKSAAKSLGLKTAQFNNCLDSNKYAKKVADMASAGAAAGVEGTPATFVNGELISGAVPFETFKQKIDGLLNKN